MLHIQNSVIKIKEDCITFTLSFLRKNCFFHFLKYLDQGEYSPQDAKDI